MCSNVRITWRVTRRVVRGMRAVGITKSKRDKNGRNKTSLSCSGDAPFDRVGSRCTWLAYGTDDSEKGLPGDHFG
jgi:hypothetical protein